MKGYRLPSFLARVVASAAWIAACGADEGVPSEGGSPAQASGGASGGSMGTMAAGAGSAGRSGGGASGGSAIRPDASPSAEHLDEAGPLVDAAREGTWDDAAKPTENSGEAGDAKWLPDASEGGAARDRTAYVPISFGTILEPSAQIIESQALAQSLANPNSATWRGIGDQHRTYRFASAGVDVPYRVCVPRNWDGTSKLPLVMFLHGASNDESSYLDQNNKQMVTLADQHGYVLVSPLGKDGAYGNFLRLPGDFSKPDEAAKLLATRTADSEKMQERSEKDVINVLEIVLKEYPIDRARMFLTGHSMGSGGTWYIGGKYATYWAALAPMSGPFVLETGYPWENLVRTDVFITEGLAASTVTGSRALRDWMTAAHFKVAYKEVNADHPGMVALVLTDVFAFFDMH